MKPYALVKNKTFTGKLKLVKLVAKRADKHNSGGSKFHVTLFIKPRFSKGI